MSDKKTYEIEFADDKCILYRGFFIDREYFIKYTDLSKLKGNYDCIEQCLEAIDKHLDNKTVEVAVKDDCIVYRGFSIWLNVNHSLKDHIIISGDGFHSRSESIGSAIKYIDSLDYKDES